MNYTSSEPDGSRYRSALGRLDYNRSEKLTFFGRYNQTPSASEFNGTQVNRIAMESRGLTLGFNLRVRPNAVVDLRMNASQAGLRSSWGSPGSSPTRRQRERDAS